MRFSAGRFAAEAVGHEETETIRYCCSSIMGRATHSYPQFFSTTRETEKLWEDRIEYA
jgi:hypothetical protein